MHPSVIFAIIGVSTSFVAASPLLAVGSPSISGVATFNNYTKQGQSVCLGKGGSQKPSNTAYFGAAVGDISKDISGGLCDGSHNGADQSPQSYDASLCVADGGQAPNSSTYQGPSCPIPQGSTCGLCFKVDNLGNIANAPLQTPIGTVTVQVIDACPAGSAQNYCKTDEPANQRCQDPTTNSLDIDVDAYQQLTGAAYNDFAHNNGHPNLNIQITPVTC